MEVPVLKFILPVFFTFLAEFLLNGRLQTEGRGHALRERTHLPVVVDPSHATGRRDFVIPMALAAVAAGADGLMVEVHTDPERALSDGAQSLYPEQFAHLSEETQKLAAALRYDAVSKL